MKRGRNGRCDGGRKGGREGGRAVILLREEKRNEVARRRTMKELERRL